MKIKVKILSGIQFEIEAEPEHTVAVVKEMIELTYGINAYPAPQQVLIHQGKVLKNDTTLEENNVTENSFVVLMLSKIKSSISNASTTSSAPTNQVVQPASSLPPTSIPSSTTSQPPASTVVHGVSNPEETPAATPSISSESSDCGQAASNLVSGHGLESTIQQILDIGGGHWDRDTVIHALRAAFNNPERAVEYLYFGIPEHAEVPAVNRTPAMEQEEDPPVQAPQPAVPVSGPNSDPLNLFPQGDPSIDTHLDAASLDFLRNSEQIHALRAMLQANPQILQPLLQELRLQNPDLMRFVEEHQSDLLRLINEPIEGEQGLAAVIPQSLDVTPEEHDAIQRLEDMGFAHELVMDAFLACNKNEELTVNYLLDRQQDD